MASPEQNPDPAPSVPTEESQTQRACVTLMITSAGNQVALIRSFRNAAKAAGIDLHVTAVDEEPENCAACLLADTCHTVPPVRDEGYVARLLQIAGKQAADILLPGSVLELGKLSAAHELFAPLHVRIAVPHRHLTEQLLDFWQLQALVRQAGADVARAATYAAVKAEPGSWTWPILVKPSKLGAEPLGKMILRSPLELSRVKPDAPVVLQEMAQGRRYVMQLYFDSHSRLRCSASARVRFHGTHRLSSAVTQVEPRLMEFATSFASVLQGPTGPIGVEAVLTSDNILLIEEILPNLSRVTPVLDRAGVPICRWLMEEALHRELPDEPSTLISGIRMLTYEAPLFVSESLGSNIC